MISNDDEEQFIRYMLDNKLIEEKLECVCRYPTSIKAVYDLLQQLVLSDADNKGIILGVKAMPDSFRSSYRLYAMQAVEMTYVTVSDSKKYVMLFTSIDKFKKCSELQGFVFFIRELFQVLADKDCVDGIAFNINSEEVLLDKSFIKAFLN